MESNDTFAAQTRLFGAAPRQPEQLTVLSYGAGQQSTAVLLKLLFDGGFRARYAPGRLLVLAADTGNEDPRTYAHLDRMRRLCGEHGEELVHITSDMGFHTAAWRSLAHHYRSGRRIGSKAFPKSCSANLKILPQFRYLAWRLANDYGLGHRRQYSRTVREYTGLSGRRVAFLIGISAEEAKRRIPDENDAPKWQREYLQRRYPLTDMGWDRADCQNYIQSLGFPSPIPSACRMCPFKTDSELVLMARTDEAGYREWVELEAAKLRAHAERSPHLPPEKNFGVWPHRTLPQALADAEEEYGHLTTEQLEAMRMTRGHAVGTRH